VSAQVQFREDDEAVEFVKEQGLNPNDLARRLFEEEVRRMRADARMNAPARAGHRAPPPGRRGRPGGPRAVTEIHRIVVDTSALIDAIDAAHPDWGEAFRTLRGRYRTEAPALIEYEAGNVVHTKHPDVFGDTPGERGEVLETLLEGIEPASTPPSSRKRCGELADGNGITFSDAAFLELADRGEDRVLVTQDEGLLAAARDVLGADRAVDLDAAGERIAHGEL
jgi:predicted nucleic acid-binding protein